MRAEDGDSVDFQIELIDAFEEARGDASRTALSPRNYIGTRCSVKTTEMEIAAWRLGWTKYLAQGLVGAILRPLLGSLSATAFFATIRWEQIRGVKSTGSKQITIWGTRDEDGRCWVLTMECDDCDSLIAELQLHIHVEMDPLAPTP